MSLVWNTSLANWCPAGTLDELAAAKLDPHGEVEGSTTLAEAAFLTSDHSHPLLRQHTDVARRLGGLAALGRKESEMHDPAEPYRAAAAAPLTAGSSPMWYFAAAGARGAEPAGPINAATLRALAAGGVFSLDTLVWSASMAQWSPLRQVKELNNVISLAPGRDRALAAYYETPPLLAVPAPTSLTSLPSCATTRFGGSPTATRYASPFCSPSASPYGALAGTPPESNSSNSLCGALAGSPRGSPSRSELDPVLWHFEDASRGVRGTASREAMQSMLQRGALSNTALVWDATPRGWTRIVDEPALAGLLLEGGAAVYEDDAAGLPRSAQHDSDMYVGSGAHLTLQDERRGATRAAQREQGRAGAPFGDQRVVATIKDPASGVHFSALLVMAPASATKPSCPALLMFAETDADIARWADVPKRIRGAFAAIRPAIVRLVASLGGARDAIVPAVRNVWSLGGAAPDYSPALAYTISLLPGTVDVFDEEARAEVVALLLKFCARVHERSGVFKGLQ